jgi:caa(3)-type oxidase subunit IV
MSEAHGESHLPVYKRVILTLGGLTAVEFVLSFWMHGSIPGIGVFPFMAGVLLLIGLAFWKAILVARFFMHVKYDPGVLAFLAVTPLILATPLVLLVGFDLVKGPNL